jgi:hypothetical protein
VESCEIVSKIISILSIESGHAFQGSLFYSVTWSKIIWILMKLIGERVRWIMD